MEIFVGKFSLMHREARLSHSGTGQLQERPPAAQGVFNLIFNFEIGVIQLCPTCSINALSIKHNFLYACDQLNTVPDDRNMVELIRAELPLPDLCIQCVGDSTHLTTLQFLLPSLSHCYWVQYMLSSTRLSLTYSPPFRGHWQATSFRPADQSKHLVLGRCSLVLGWRIWSS